MNVVEATGHYTNEHWQVIVRNAEGGMRAGPIHISRDNQERINVRLPNSGMGESAIVIHSHYGGVNAEQLSDVDIAFGRENDVPVYVVGQDWSIRVFEEKQETITRILP